MSWTFLLSDFDGNGLGEVTDAHDRKINRELNGISSARFTIRGDHPLAPQINDENLLLRCYDDNKVLRFHGSISVMENVAEGSDYTITCSFVDSGATLDGRVNSLISIFHTNNDSGKLARLCVFQRQRQHPTKHGIWLHTSAEFYNSGSLIAWHEAPYLHALQSIVELSESAAGFDWHIEPIEITIDSAGDPCIGAWTSAGVIGTSKPNAIFEWGTGQNNVKSWRRAKDWTQLANIVFSSTGEPPTRDASGVVQQAVASDSASITEFGEHFHVIDSYGIEELSFRQEVADAHLEVRKQPRQIYTFTPTSTLVSVPRFGVDYYLGDLVTFRAKHNSNTLFNGQVRVYGVEIDIDDNGQAVEKPTVEVQ